MTLAPRSGVILSAESVFILGSSRGFYYSRRWNLSIHGWSTAKDECNMTRRTRDNSLCAGTIKTVMGTFCGWPLVTYKSVVAQSTASSTAVLSSCIVFECNSMPTSIGQRHGTEDGANVVCGRGSATAPWFINLQGHSDVREEGAAEAGKCLSSAFWCIGPQTQTLKLAQQSGITRTPRIDQNESEFFITIFWLIENCVVLSLRNVHGWKPQISNWWIVEPTTREWSTQTIKLIDSVISKCVYHTPSTLFHCKAEWKMWLALHEKPIIADQHQPKWPIIFHNIYFCGRYCVYTEQWHKSRWQFSVLCVSVCLSFTIHFIRFFFIAKIMARIFLGRERQRFIVIILWRIRRKFIILFSDCVECSNSEWLSKFVASTKAAHFFFCWISSELSECFRLRMNDLLSLDGICICA